MESTSSCGGSQDCMSNTCSDHAPKRRVIELEQQIQQLQSTNDRQKEMLDNYLKEIKYLKEQFNIITCPMHSDIPLTTTGYCSMCNAVYQPGNSIRELEAKIKEIELAESKDGFCLSRLKLEKIKKLFDNDDSNDHGVLLDKIRCEVDDEFKKMFE